MRKINDGLTKYERYRLKNIELYRENKREWAKTPEQKEKRREYARKWREKNREKHNTMAKVYHHKHKHKHKIRNENIRLKAKYGITLEFYNLMFEKQEGSCLICKTKWEQGTRRMHVDHNHITGKVRGLLCGSCNTKLGWYEKLRLGIEEYLK